jgi:hypothetical protein
MREHGIVGDRLAVAPIVGPKDPAIFRKSFFLRGGRE